MNLSTNILFSILLHINHYKLSRKLSASLLLIKNKTLHRLTRLAILYNIRIPHSFIQITNNDNPKIIEYSNQNSTVHCLETTELIFIRTEPYKCVSNVVFKIRIDDFIDRDLIKVGLLY